MERALHHNQAVDPATVLIKVNKAPIKTAGSELVAPELLGMQAEQARNCLVLVDYELIRGTCIDERLRALLAGGGEIEARPSVPGGPDIYALAIAELTGHFGESDKDSKSRLKEVKSLLGDGGIQSGGHDGCAANKSFATWMRTIAENSDAVKAYVVSQMSENYDETMADEVCAWAKSVIEGGRYKDWQETNLREALGEEESKDAIEVLENVDHEAVTLIRNKIAGTTVDQNALYGISVIGKGSFVHDDAYADKIEHVIASGPAAERQKRLAEHAREFILAAVANAVPNPELYQIDLLPQ